MEWYIINYSWGPPSAWRLRKLSGLPPLLWRDCLHIDQNRFAPKVFYTNKLLNVYTLNTERVFSSKGFSFCILYEEALNRPRPASCKWSILLFNCLQPCRGSTFSTWTSPSLTFTLGCKTKQNNKTIEMGPLIPIRSFLPDWMIILNTETKEKLISILPVQPASWRLYQNDIQKPYK